MSPWFYQINDWREDRILLKGKPKGRQRMCEKEVWRACYALPTEHHPEESAVSTKSRQKIFENNSRNFQKADPEFATHRHLFTQRWHCIRYHKLKYMWVCAGCVQILCHLIWKTWASVDFGVSLSWRSWDQSSYGRWGTTVCCRFK